MVVAIVISTLLYYNANSQIIPEVEPWYSDTLITCVANIVTKYFASRKILTYVGNKQDDEVFLKEIHDLNVVTLVSRRSSRKLPVRHESYFISGRNSSLFAKRFPNLTKETTWNPDGYFLILVRSLNDDQFEEIFNELLKRHVNNVIVINATAEAHLYSYNPFGNYGCGKRYTDIISYGECLQTHMFDLFPDKSIKGFQNCTFNVAIPNWPPYATFPSNDTHNSPLSHGVEPYLLKLVGEMENFTLNIILKNGTETFSTISPDMEADGPLKMLQNNEVDVILGGLLLTPSRAVVFECVYDLLPYVDEIRFVVKRAEFVAAWKTFYLEFDGIVWALILLSLTFYSIIMIILLRVKDKSLLVLKLLDSLVLHSCNIPCNSMVKCFFIIWVWFAYLINAFYQSSLVSLTTNPAMEHQISTEHGIIRHKLKPCFNDIIEKYYKESTQSGNTNDNVSISECQGKGLNVLQNVICNKEYYSLIPYGLYEYNIQNFYDDYGNHQLYLLKKPYSKILYCMYFYKGFPLIHDISLSALRLREMGLVGKAISDMNYLQAIKHRFRGNSKNLRFVIPWHIYILGCIVSIVTFIMEVLSTRNA